MTDVRSTLLGFVKPNKKQESVFFASKSLEKTNEVAKERSKKSVYVFVVNKHEAKNRTGKKYFACYYPAEIKNSRLITAFYNGNEIQQQPLDETQGKKLQQNETN